MMRGLSAGIVLAMGCVSVALASDGKLKIMDELQAPYVAPRTQKTAYGEVLTTNRGMTLYTYDYDFGGKPTCTGPCAKQWPPLMATPDARPHGLWTLVTRDDGRKQWAYRGKPLYAWSQDQKPGDANGHGYREAWHVAKPYGGDQPQAGNLQYGGDRPPGPANVQNLPQGERRN